MTISDLVQSPAQMYLDGAKDADVKSQSQYYQLDQKTLGKYCSALESFYPQLIKHLKAKRNSQFPIEQWIVWCKSIEHIFLCVLIDRTIIEKTKLNCAVESETKMVTTPSFQTQENLMLALPYDQGTRKVIFFAAWSLSCTKSIRFSQNSSFGHIYSMENLRYYVGKKIRSKGLTLSRPEKPVIGLVGASQVLPHLHSSTRDRFDWENMDDVIDSFYAVPSFPDAKLRKRLEVELRSLFEDLNLPSYFPILGDRKLVATTLASLATALLPVQDVEGFQSIQQKMEKLISALKPEVVITSTGPHDDLSSLYLAQAQKRHIPMLSLQHGAGYAEYRSMQTERSLETLLYNTCFLSWGEGMKQLRSLSKLDIIPLGSPYLNSLPRCGFSHKKITRILIPLEPIYYYQILDGFTPTQPGFVEENYRILIQFLETIHLHYPEIAFVFKIKAGHERQYKIRQYLSPSLHSHVCFTTKGRTYDYFDHETLVFLPTLSGAFHEAMMAEVPFLLYMPSDQNFFHADLKNFFVLLEKENVSGSTVESLVRAFRAQYEGKVRYTSLRSKLKQFHDFASLRNSNWERDLLHQIEIRMSPEPVIVLSGEHFVLKKGKLDPRAIDNRDNIARIKKAVSVANQSVTTPMLLLNGATRQLPLMRKIAKSFGFPDEKIINLDCTIEGATNTKTQFEAVRNYYKSKMPKQFTIVTSNYHALRAEKTARKVLGSNCQITMISSKYPGNTEKLVKEEVAKILTYHAKGDIE